LSTQVATVEDPEEAAVLQWEPQGWKFVHRYYIKDMSPEEVMQEMRIEIIRAYRDFDPSKGVKFHTLVYRYMQTKILRLIQYTKFQKRQAEIVYFGNESDNSDDRNNSTLEIGYEVDFDPWAWAKELDLTRGESILLDLLICGYKRKDIRKLCVDDANFRITFNSLKEKAKGLLDE
tara:strand:+ start:1684 stop:2211 length:528 start_codon:yes stop_codon:yes gene_type:complete